MAQPRGTVNGHFRATEQGEMITQNFGHPGIAVSTLDTYIAAILHYGFEPPEVHSKKWRETIDRLSEVSCEAYRDIVRRHERFVPYFRTATPELELGSLNFGSRPAKRRPTGGVETLRAIPWVFSWTQIFFETILAKSDLGIAQHYDKELVSDAKAKELGSELRRRLQETAAEILKVSQRPRLIAYNELLRWQLVLRKPYLDPVNVMQAHILHRLRSGVFSSPEEEQQLKDALVIAIKGIAGGMRNTG